MSATFPTQAQVVIIGGGINGCSLAYHLTKLGWKDVVLLERKKLTCGTTWHAAGLVAQLRATHNMTLLAKYTAELYRGLEEETGQATGFRQTGSLTIASSTERFEELKRSASMGHCFDVEVDVLTAQQAGEMWPLLNIDDVVGAIHIPKDGMCNPIDTTQALAKGAKMGGASIYENTKVLAVHQTQGRVTGVTTDKGDITAEYVANCAGMWSREVGKMCGVNVPLHAAEHFYIVTEPMQGMTPDLPILRDLNGHAYYKQDAGKLLLGAFETNAKPWGMDGIPEDFSFDSLPEDWDHFEPVMEKAIHRLPALEDAGIQLFFCGPESFTPDDRYLLGEAPELKNFFVAAGFNSVGIQSAGGAGKVLASWIVDGAPPMDLWDVDIRRMAPFQGNSRYLHDRTIEALGLLYDMHWPFRQFESARGIKRSPLHDRLLAKGACFGENTGWERPNWYAPEGVEPKYEYSFGRQNWFDYNAREHKAVREGVGLFDQTSFAKFLVQGKDAENVMNRICANDVSVAQDKIVYTQWLNERGGIEADLTVTRLGEDQYFVVTAFATEYRDFNWLKKNIGEDDHCTVTNVTSGYAVISVMGPNSRDLLSGLTSADLSNAAFPFGTSREIELGYALVRATRITFVGELGWELYIPTEFAVAVYDLIVEHGQKFDLQHAGYHTLNSCRIEKAYRHWGHDITDEDSPLEAGLGFAIAWDKPGGFTGREALLKQKETGTTRRLVTFALKSPEPLMYHEEPIFRDGVKVGSTTSAMYGHTVGASIALGYVENEGGVSKDFVESGDFEIEVAAERVPARASLRAFYDPKHERIKI
ncbi:MAG: FAD-dependent oxidoreductase [Arenicellales bacterium]|nr:FAD-dependent oxidoreductase [Arenicellales bacterium]